MVERYAREEMKKLWDMNAKYSAWLEVEKALVKGWNTLGLIPDEEIDGEAIFRFSPISEFGKIE